jgi:hypothetical protein
MVIEQIKGNLKAKKYIVKEGILLCVQRNLELSNFQGNYM